MNSLGLNGPKIHEIYIVELFKKRLHDDMMQCKRCNKQNKSHDKTQNSWKSSGASVSGRHNTPPLQEDLVPRYRMAPERKRKRKRRGKTKLLLRPMSETKEPCGVEKLIERTQRS